MRKAIMILSSLFLCFSLFKVGVVGAQDGAVAQTEVTTNVEEQLENAQAARAEEDQLRQQIKTAMDSGDMQTAKQLREQLRSVHQENIQEKAQDMQNIQAAKQEFKSDVQEARQAGGNNPPGPKGGSGAGPAKPQAGPRGKK